MFLFVNGDLYFDPASILKQKTFSKIILCSICHVMYNATQSRRTFNEIHKPAKIYISIMLIAIQ